MPRASTHIFRVRLWPKVYRDIEIDSRKSLYDLAAAIVRAFGFDFDDAFGFFSKLTGHIYDSPVRYELFADLDDVSFPEMDRHSKSGSVKRTTEAQAFPEVGSKCCSCSTTATIGSSGLRSLALTRRCRRPATRMSPPERLHRAYRQSRASDPQH